jgi:2-iminobutanoate/2-iminopropanoate deaminase
VEDAREVRTQEAPAPVGPYSQAVQHGSWIFVSGQIPLDPATGQLVAGGIEAEAERVIDNLEAVLRAGGSSLQRVIRATVYLTDLADFPRVNEIYARRLTGDPAPARATVQVAGLPLGASIEIDAIALAPTD